MEWDDGGGSGDVGIVVWSSVLISGLVVWCRSWMSGFVAVVDVENVIDQDKRAQFRSAR